MTCPSTRCIFAFLFLNYLDDKDNYRFQQVTKNRSHSAKQKYETNTNSNISNKATPASAYLKKYFTSDSNQNMRLRLPTVTQHLWLKPKQLI